MIFFLVLGLLSSFRVTPDTQTVSRFSPKLCAPLQRKFGTDAAYRAGRRYTFDLVSRGRITTNGIILSSAPTMRRRLSNEEVAGFFVDLAHRNQTKASWDAQIRGTLSTGSSVPMKIDPTLGGGNKRYRVRGEVDLSARLQMAGGAGEATCAACHF